MLTLWKALLACPIVLVMIFAMSNVVVAAEMAEFQYFQQF